MSYKGLMQGCDSLLTPWSGVLLGNLTGFQLVMKFPAFTSARHLSLSWASSTQSIHHIPLPENPS
jgi:hypothetical protein